MYAAVHALSILVFGMRHLHQSPISTLFRLLRATFWSSTFLSTNTVRISVFALCIPIYLNAVLDSHKTVNLCNSKQFATRFRNGGFHRRCTCFQCAHFCTCGNVMWSRLLRDLAFFWNVKSIDPS